MPTGERPRLLPVSPKRMSVAFPEACYVACEIAEIVSARRSETRRVLAKLRGSQPPAQNPEKPLHGARFGRVVRKRRVSQRGLQAVCKRAPAQRGVIACILRARQLERFPRSGVLSMRTCRRPPWPTQKSAAGMQVPAYAIDDQTAIKVTDATVEVVSEGHWKLFTPSPEASESGS
jgi:hypothetical protein